MKNNIMYFTNLGIVKCLEFELTNDLFFDKMCELININPNNNYVSYDEVNDKYQVVLHSHIYDVKFGRDGLCEKKDTIELLNKLIKMNHEVKEIKKEEENKKRYDDSKRKEIFERVNDGFIETNEDKLAKIVTLRNENKKNGSIFKRIWNLFKKMNVGYVSEDRAAGEIVGSTLLFVIASFVFNGLGTGTSLLIGSGVFAFVAIDGFIALSNTEKENGYRGYICSIISILTLPLNILYNVVKKIVDDIKYNREIKSIKKSITNLNEEKEYIPKSNISIKEINNFMRDVVEKSIEKAPTNLKTTYETTNEIKNNILLIKDKSVSKKLAMELYDIIKYYIDANSYLKDKNNIPTILYSQLMDLSKKVDEELKKEKEQEETKNECNELIESITYQKSIGNR